MTCADVIIWSVSLTARGCHWCHACVERESSPYEFSLVQQAGYWGSARHKPIHRILRVIASGNICAGSRAINLVQTIQ
jgi:hypothetical protein